MINDEFKLIWICLSLVRIDKISGEKKYIQESSFFIIVYIFNINKNVNILNYNIKNNNTNIILFQLGDLIDLQSVSLIIFKYSY